MNPVIYDKILTDCVYTIIMSRSARFISPNYYSFTYNCICNAFRCLPRRCVIDQIDHVSEKTSTVFYQCK